MNPQSFQASRSAFVTWGLIWGVPLSLGIAASFRNSSAIGLPIIAFLALLLTYVWLAAYRLQITPDEIAYRSLLKGTVRIKRVNIQGGKVRIGHKSIKDVLKPFVRLEIKSDLEPLSINLKVFSQRDREAIAKAIEK